MATATLTGKKIREAMQIPRITPCELQVWRLLVQGYSVVSAAALLGKSPKTIESQRDALKVKLRTAGYVPPALSKQEPNPMAWLIATAYRFGLVAAVDVDPRMQSEMSDEVRLVNINDIIFHRCRHEQATGSKTAPALAFHP